jgi:hypothetical protein
MLFGILAMLCFFIAIIMILKDFKKNEASYIGNFLNFLGWIFYLIYIFSTW